MSPLGDRIAALEKLKSTRSAPQADPVIKTAPKGWEAGTRYEGESLEVTTLPLPANLEAKDWPEAVAAMGITVPDGFRVRLTEAKYYSTAWHRDPKDRGEKFTAYTGPAWLYRFVVEPDASNVSAEDLVAEISRWRPRKRDLPSAGTMSFVVAPGDLQLGKIDGEGSAGIVERFLDKIEASVQELKALRKQGYDIGDVYLVFLGDCIEGYNSQGGRLAKRTDLSMTEMVRVYRRLATQAIKMLAPHAHRLIVLGIPGNHDEAIRTGDKMSTFYDDSWAIEGLSAVQDGLEEREDFSHVSFVFPHRDELTVTLDIDGTITGFAHGHQFGSGKDYAHAWWAKQAHGCQQIGDATLMMSGHLHHLRVEQPGAKTFIQVPALDGGSTWFKHRQGADAPPGLVCLMVGGGGWSGLKVL